MNKDFAKKMIGYASASVLGKNVNLRFEGDDRSVSIMDSTIQASRHLYEALEDSNTTISLIRDALNQKHTASAQFKQHFGFTWPL